MSSEVQETKRDRVRRLLIGPLQEAGFRHPAKSDAAKNQAELDRIADSLAYLNDRDLGRMRALLLTKGEGSARHFWPSYATIMGFAEACRPRPLEAVPELLGWFRSRAGEAALAGDRLVAEYLFWEKLKRPPIYPQDKARVAERAAEWSSRAERIRERQSRPDRGVMADDVEWLAWYDALHTRVAAIVAEGSEARGSEDAA